MRLAKEPDEFVKLLQVFLPMHFPVMLLQDGCYINCLMFELPQISSHLLKVDICYIVKKKKC
jgi:hypothetical protein